MDIITQIENDPDRGTERLSNTPPPPAPLTPDQIIAYLDYAMEKLIARRADVLDVLMSDATTPINDDDELGRIGENMKMAAALVGVAEKQRVAQKDPFLSGGRAVDGWFKTFRGPVDTARIPLQERMNAYGRLKEAQARAAAIEAKARADIAAAKAAAQAAEIMAREKPASEIETNHAFATATRAAQDAERADIRANARPADLTRTTGIYGTTISMRSSWSWLVTDIRKVPREYLVISPDALKIAAKDRDERGKPIAKIDGITWVETSKMGVR